jgi:endonuclease IV
MSKENTKDDLAFKKLINNIDSSKQTGLGCHIWKVPGYGNHAEIAINHYMKEIPKLGCFQIFSHGPRSKHPVKQDDTNKLYLLAKKIPLFIHSSYLTSPKIENDTTHFVDQIYAARQYGARGVVIHIPKASVHSIIEMTQNMIEAIRNNPYFAKLIDKFKGSKDPHNFGIPRIPRIIWEAKAIKKSNESFETPEKWNLLADALFENEISPEMVGLNIDTAHIYASGAQIKTFEEATKWLSGLSKLTMTYMKSGLLHFNGNEYDQNVRAGDKHAIPGSKEDKIWIDVKNPGYIAFITWARTNNIPIICELKNDVLDIAKFINLQN